MGMDEYDNSIFINCPFDDEYHHLFYAILFCIADCGFLARCAQEEEDSGQVRIEKIVKIIASIKIYKY
jgi:hypothetical protein